MSKLANAPLVEVIFELRCKIEPSEFETIQYLQADLYPHIREQYPYREALESLPIQYGINLPSHRFRREIKGYPLVQVGPGMISVNTTDETYFWDKFESEISNVVGKLNQVYSFKESHNPQAILQYIDFIKFDFEKNDILDFLKKKLHISINHEQPFYKPTINAFNLNYGFQYKDPLGQLVFQISRGTNPRHGDGIAIQSSLSNRVVPKQKEIGEWLNKSHELLSSMFKSMTSGELYNSFSNKK